MRATIGSLWSPDSARQRPNRPWPPATGPPGTIAIKPERSVVARLEWAEVCPTSVRACGAPSENRVRFPGAQRNPSPHGRGGPVRVSERTKTGCFEPRRRRNAVTNRGPIRQALGSTTTNHCTRGANSMPKTSICVLLGKEAVFENEPRAAFTNGVKCDSPFLGNTRIW